MKVPPCCRFSSQNPCSETAISPPTIVRRRLALGVHRLLDVAGWAIPGVVLTLLPKCPVCLAGYVALATGVGLSLPIASLLRTLLLIACVVSLGFLAARWLRRWLGKSIASNRDSGCCGKVS